jgi:two-component system C4-dicarboxylate transport sensor histidine kinase DctB
MAAMDAIQRDARRGRGLVLAGLLGVLLVASVSYGAATLQRQLRADVVEDGEAALTLYTEMTRGWLDRYMALAPIYARDPLVIAALLAPGSLQAEDALNRKLERWNTASGTSDTYVMDLRGVTVGASNWAEDYSFVGRNFGYRPYFREAAEGRLGRFFGLGTTSGQRGYYFAAPVRGAGGVIGVVVVKASVDGLEQDLRLGAHPAFVTDEAGIILMAGNPVLRMTALEPVSETDRARIAATRQFDLDTIALAPLQPAGGWGGGAALLSGPSDRTGSGTVTALHLTRPMAAENWQMHVLVDTAPVRAGLWLAAVLLAAALVVALAIAGLIWERRRRLIDRLREREQAQAMLERRVAERTADLSAANAALQTEVGERRAAETSLRQTQSELVQAGKLAALGQMSAALSHEFNQPLTAIRTYSENAIAFLEAGAGPKASENLSRVLRLTERMAQLSKHLTRFARRSPETVNPVDLDEALAETLALLQGRLERAEAEVIRAGDTGLRVLGGQVRLQHVFMNLIGNALDAVPEGTRPRIVVEVAERGDAVTIAVTDNGAGIPAEVLARIFDPFFTTKEVGKGLGLGLSISFNIVKDFGGTMQAENRPEGGARFVVTQRRAAPARSEAAE